MLAKLKTYSLSTRFDSVVGIKLNWNLNKNTACETYFCAFISKCQLSSDSVKLLCETEYVGVDAAQSKVGPPCCFQMIALKDVCQEVLKQLVLSLSPKYLQLLVITCISNIHSSSSAWRNWDHGFLNSVGKRGDDGLFYDFIKELRSKMTAVWGDCFAIRSLLSSVFYLSLCSH